MTYLNDLEIENIGTNSQYFKKQVCLQIRYRKSNTKYKKIMNIGNSGLK